MTKAIPEGYHSLTPCFTFKDSEKAIEFYKKAFNAEVKDSFPNLDGNGIMHAVVQIGNSLFMMGDEMPGSGCESAEALGGSPISLYIYVTDADKAFKKALQAGGEEVMPIDDMFWGDRAGTIKDPFGYQWTLATHQKDLSAKEMKKGAEDFFNKMGKKNK